MNNSAACSAHAEWEARQEKTVNTEQDAGREIRISRIVWHRSERLPCVGSSFSFAHSAVRCVQRCFSRHPTHAKSCRSQHGTQAKFIQRELEVLNNRSLSQIWWQIYALLTAPTIHNTAGYNADLADHVLFIAFEQCYELPLVRIPQRKSEAISHENTFLGLYSEQNNLISGLIRPSASHTNPENLWTYLRKPFGKKTFGCSLCLSVQCVPCKIPNNLRGSLFACSVRLEPVKSTGDIMSRSAHRRCRTCLLDLLCGHSHLCWKKCSWIGVTTAAQFCQNK